MLTPPASVAAVLPMLLTMVAPMLQRESTVLHTGPDKLRGAVLADLDPTSPGLEAATAGYDGTLRAFTFANDEWREAIVARDTDRFHHLTSGVLPGWDGTVLIGVNYSGKVTVAGKSR